MWSKRNPKKKIRPCRRCGGQGKEAHGGLFFTTCRACKGRGQVAQ